MPAKMHAPLRYATDQLLLRAGVAGGLQQLLIDANAQDRNAQVTGAMITQLTEGVIVVDRRTVARWMESAGEPV